MNYYSLSEFSSLKMPKTLDAKIIINNSIIPNKIAVSIFDLPWHPLKSKNNFLQNKVPKRMHRFPVVNSALHKSNQSLLFRISVYGVGRKSRQADRDIFSSISARRAVTHPLAAGNHNSLTFANLMNFFPCFNL